MKIAYFTPLNPIVSGISDFAEELLPYLENHLEVDIFVDNITPTNLEIKKRFKIFQIEDFHNNRFLRQQYDFLIYQFGNNALFHQAIIETFQKFGGIIELHDPAMHHYVAEAILSKNKLKEYLNILEYCHGELSVQIALEALKQKTPLWDDDLKALSFCLIKHFIDQAQSVIVHSEFAKQMVLGCNSHTHCQVIPLPCDDIIPFSQIPLLKINSCKKLGLDPNLLILGSFGHASFTRRIPSILHALKKFKDTCNKPFLFLIVGKLIDRKISQQIIDLDLTNNVMITNYVELDAFKDFLGACDICFNLRYPTQGETSATLSRMLGLGKAIIVTNVGSYADYPDNVVLKVSHGTTEVQEIFENIHLLSKSLSALSSFRQKSLQYAHDNLDKSKIALDYLHFFEKTHSESTKIHLFHNAEDQFVTTIDDFLNKSKLLSQDFFSTWNNTNTENYQNNLIESHSNSTDSILPNFPYHYINSFTDLLLELQLTDTKLINKLP